jgi:hypothetical protein
VQDIRETCPVRRADLVAGIDEGADAAQNLGVHAQPVAQLAGDQGGVARLVAVPLQFRPLCEVEIHTDRHAGAEHENRQWHQPGGEQSAAVLRACIAGRIFLLHGR